jgi:hypothetical protein
MNLRTFKSSLRDGPEDVKKIENIVGVRETLEHKEAIESQRCLKVSLSHQLFGIAWDAYSKHHNLVISPDDVNPSISIALAKILA